MIRRNFWQSLKKFCTWGSEPPYIFENWEKWKEDLPELSQLAVKRCVKPVELREVKFAVVHHFVDASQFAFGAVSYLRMVDSSDNAYCSFLMGKSRVAHIKPMTVPRLKLSAAVLAVQLDETLKSELEIPLHQSVFWTDSTTVLQFKPADDASRGPTVETMIQNSRWLSGPGFLTKEEHL